MATLDRSEQVFIVQRLAEYKTPTQVVDLVKHRFGVEVSRQQVEYYDPTKGREPAEKWQSLFWETRNAIREGRADVAVAHQRWRLMEMLEMYRELKRMGSYSAALDVLEQAAKEEGGQYVKDVVDEKRDDEKLSELLDRMAAMRTDTDEYHPPDMG